MADYGWSRLRDETEEVGRTVWWSALRAVGRSLDFTLGVMRSLRRALSRRVMRSDWCSLWLNLATVWRMASKGTRVEVGISQW